MKSARKPKLRPYDKMLKRFAFQAAVDYVLLEDRDPVVIVSLFEELAARDVLRQALASREESRLKPLLEFLTRQISNPHYSGTLIDVANQVLDTYTPIVGQSELIDELFVKLTVKVQAELKLQHELQALAGMLEMIMATMPEPCDQSSSDEPESEEDEIDEMAMDEAEDQ